jgi:PBP1b-binding outer membrane lipoprotein LpoB
MQKHKSIVALSIITLALVSCSKKSSDTTLTQQNASDVQVVTNANGSVTSFTSRIKNITNSTPATNGLRRGKKIVIKGNTVTDVPDP